MANRDTSKRYSEEQIMTFLELAEDIGLGPARRSLGYPGSWITAKKWAEARGIEIELNELKSKAKQYDLWYEDRDVLLAAEEGMERVSEKLQREDLDPDEIKKLSEALQKFTNTWLTVQGKPSNVSQTQHKDGSDLELAELLNEERMKQNNTVTEHN